MASTDGAAAGGKAEEEIVHSVAVVGSGNWGSAIARIVGRNGVFCAGARAATTGCRRQFCAGVSLSGWCRL